MSVMRGVVLATVVACGRIGFEPGGTGDLGGTGDAAIDAGRPAANIMFVTSTAYSPLMGSLDPYNAICQTTAEGAGLAGTYVAWLVHVESASAQISAARGFVRRDGLVVGDLSTDIASAMRRPVALDERGIRVPSGTVVMTGAGEGGEPLGNCNGLNQAAGMITAGYADGTKLAFGSGLFVPCTGSYALYCIENDRSVAVSEPAQVGRRAFVSTNGWSPGSGIGQADLECSSSAANAGLTGLFKALLATATQSAASRFSAAGANWVRLDGVPVAATPADFLTGNWIAPLNVQVDGTRTQFPMMFGAPDPTVAGTPASTCSSWTLFDTSVQIMGDAASVGGRQFLDVNRTCQDGGWLYCVEE